MESEEELLKSRVEELKSWRPKIVFQTKEMICFREIEDLIAYMLKHPFRFYQIPAWRYYCREDGRSGTKGMNRLYYKVVVGENMERKTGLVCGDATDYSGHGSSDMELAEYFIQKVLRLPLEERPLSYLFSDLENELYKLTVKGKGL